MTRFYGLLRAAAVFVLLGVATGCGGTVLEAEGVEIEVGDYLRKSLHENVESVECPAGEPVEAGRVVECDVTLKSGQRKVVSIEIVNEDADIRVAHYGGSGGSNE